MLTLIVFVEIIIFFTAPLSLSFYIWMLTERAKTYGIESIQNVFDNPNAYWDLPTEALIFAVLAYAIWHMAEGVAFRCVSKRFEDAQNYE